MPWQASLTVVKNATLADLATAGLEPTGETSPARAAVAAGLRPAIHAVPVGDDVLLIGGVDPTASTELPAQLAAALGTEVVNVRLVSSLDYWTWTVHHADGVRRLQYAEGELVTDEGDPLPEEAQLFGLGERALLGLLEARTGITRADWLDGSTQLLRRTAPPAKAKRRGLFRRR